MAGHVPTKAELVRLLEAFREAKAENDPLLLADHAFVQTKTYRQALDGYRSLVVGRKGSGKSALLLGFQREREQHYFAHGAIAIRADDFPLEALFSFFYTDSRRAMQKVSKQLSAISDLGGFLEPVKIAAYAWAQTLRCSAVYIAARRLLLNSDLGPEKAKQLARARKAIGRYIGQPNSKADSGPEVVFALLVYFFQTVQQVIDQALGIHTHEISVALAAITHAVTLKLNGGLDRRIEDAAKIISSELELERKHCLLTLDRFDDFYDEFYRRSKRADGSQERSEFLASLLEGLVIATRDMKRDPRFKWLDTLFAVPMDKFLELHLRERVDLEQSHILKLEWTPAELRDYVNRRIAHALDLPPEDVDSAWDRIFPFHVTNRTVRDTREDSLLYIIRHTLWRPRELQMYLSALFKRLDERLDTTRNAPDEEMIWNVVRTQAEEIIRQEFLEEFGSEYPELPAVVKRLQTLKLRSVMPYTELCDRIGTVKLADEMLSPAETVKRLWQMGILGIREVVPHERREVTDPSVTQNREEVVYRYVYNCSITDPFSPSSDVAFHPMFFEYLEIKHDAPFVVNQLNWDMFPSG
jgi:hypothetical protein